MIVCSRILTCAATLFALVALLGCGGDVSTVPVSGRVTLDGEPLAEAHVSFEPVRSTGEEASVGSYATTDAKGEFTLLLVTTGQPGAMPGQHEVRITTARPEDPSREDSPISPELVPSQYHEGLDVEIPNGGTDSVEISLLSTA